MTKILITGGAGYIGSHAVKRILEEGHDVVVIDNFSNGYKQALDNIKHLGNLTVVEADLRNKEQVSQVFDDHKIDAVMHFAALISVNESTQKPYDYFQTNIFGSLNILESMREHGVKNLIISSTCALYGDAQYLPVDEIHPHNPDSPYGKSKEMMEAIAKWYSDLFDLHYISLRYFNVGGSDPDTLVGYSKTPSQTLIHNAVKGALGIQKFEITCGKVDTPDGTTIRDYVDIVDLIDAHVLALDYLLKGGKSEIINVGTGKGYSVLEIIQAVEKVCNVDLGRNMGEPRNGESPRIFASRDKAKEILGWEPKRELEDMILTLKEWFEKYPKGFDY